MTHYKLNNKEKQDIVLFGLFLQDIPRYGQLLSTPSDQVWKELPLLLGGIQKQASSFILRVICSEADIRRGLWGKASSKGRLLLHMVQAYNESK